MKTMKSKPQKQKVAAKAATAKARKTANNFSDSFDPNGSYTGCPLDGGMPIQDVDDL